MNYYVCGKILNTHGLKGNLKIRSLSDFDRFEKGNTLYIHYKEEYIQVEVLRKTDNKDHFLVAFKDLEDINLVEKYKNTFIYIKEEDMESLPEGEFYFHDLIGKNLVNQEGVIRGKVENVREVPQGHLLVVVVDGKNKFIPFRKEFIGEIDEENINFIEIEGLL